MGLKHSKIKISEYDNAMLQLKSSRDTLRVYQKRLEYTIHRDIELAKILLKKGNKRGALLAIKKKKLQNTRFG